MVRSRHYYIRKFHRYFGVILGIQFLFWTLGGLYFSWNDIDKVHGDHLRKEKRYLPAALNLVSPQIPLRELQATTDVDSINSIQLVEVLGLPTYQIRYYSKEDTTQNAQPGDAHGGGHAVASSKVQLANATTGQLMAPLNKETAVQVALNNVVAPAQVEKVEYLAEVSGHHEYREKPLPAWAVTFSEPNCTVYVSAELGTFQAIRHNQWRMFDFLWMLHTMDFQTRDNIGNLLLKAFSFFGLITVLSGFVLYFVSSSAMRKVKKKAGGL
ncbi:PepSY domain-containing protein [Rufibacter roseolus]|uniref:PepSY domain-containing protein n=1 Tax=Rufibacter roseolus TaxID=2817375 RepID=UPI001B30CD4E|nr:PepSY domain-containing protein [Rufibacter roseolus]